MTACASADQKGATKPAASQTTAQAAELNPQDDSFEASTTDFAALFQPIQLGGKQSKNRIVKSAAGSYAVNEAVNEQAIGYYPGRARPGRSGRGGRGRSATG